jgi:hypothetical protein
MTEKDEKIYELFRALITGLYNCDNGTLIREDLGKLFDKLEQLYRAITR